MAEVTGFTTDAVLGIDEPNSQSVVDGHITPGGRVILETRVGDLIDIGQAGVGPKGDTGDTGDTGDQGPPGSRWGTTGSWIFGTIDIPVSFTDGQPPRVGDFILSNNGFGLGDVGKVIEVISSTVAKVALFSNIRGPAGVTPAFRFSGVVPTDGIGVKDDVTMVTTTGDLYQMNSSGVWVSQVGVVTEPDWDLRKPRQVSTTISGSSITVGTITNVVVNFGVTFDTPPDVRAHITGPFVSGSSGLLVRGVDTITTSSARILVVNHGATTATFTDVPLTCLVTPL